MQSQISQILSVMLHVYGLDMQKIWQTLSDPLGSDEKDLSIQELYAEITDNDFRNQQIVEDVLKNYSQGRNCVVLSLRTAHVELLAK